MACTNFQDNHVRPARVQALIRAQSAGGPRLRAGTMLGTPSGKGKTKAWRVWNMLFERVPHCCGAFCADGDTKTKTQGGAIAIPHLRDLRLLRFLVTYYTVEMSSSVPPVVAKMLR